MTCERKFGRGSTLLVRVDPSQAKIRKIQSLLQMASFIRKCLIQSAWTRESAGAGTLLLHLFWLSGKLKMRNC